MLDVTLAALLVFATPSNSNGCGAQMANIGACATVSNGGTQLDIGGTQTQPGNVGTGSGGGGGGGYGAAPPLVRLTPAERGSPDCAPDAELCTPVYTDPVDAEEAEPADDIPEVTLADLASFVPAAPALEAEPGAAGVVGMPTNFVAGATVQTETGALFGRPVTVRFTPVTYVFEHGDGTTARSATGGARWADLGQAQFTATPTSHAYGERGTYVASASVEYAPEVDFGGGWQPVAGVVTASAGSSEITVYEVRTALVERTCIENPRGPGC